MPLPNPKPGEEQDKWVSRCMGNDAMKEEFPDNKQRQAVCFQKWRDKDKKTNDMTNIERRSGPVEDVHVRRVGDDLESPATISGYAAVFNSLSEDLGGFREKIAPGAFKRTLADKADIKALVDHQTGLETLGRTQNGTLELEQDKKGLRVSITPPDTTAGRDIITLVERGDLNQMSFAFRVAEDGQSWEEGKKGETIRTVSDADLFDVSIVTFPAYAATSVAVRSMAAWRSEQDRAVQRQREMNQRLLDNRYK